MNKESTRILLGIQLFLCMMFLINLFVINIKNIYIISSFLMINALLVICFLGYEKNRQRLKKDAFLNALIYASLLQIVFYLSGLFFGFLKNSYSMQPIMIIKNTLPTLLLIISTEILRYTINQKGRESKGILICSCITFVIIEVSVSAIFYNLADKRNFIELICLIFLPSVTKNIFLTYNTTKFGFGSSIIYRIIMETIGNFIPIIPNISDYLYAVISFLYPILILLITKKTLGKNIPYEEVVNKKTNKISLFIIIIFIMTIIVLNSGVASLYMLAIGSGSMEKTLHIGDAVIVKKINKDNIDTLKEGDILVYNYQSKIIVHRIYAINYDNNNINIKTKGDNNEYPDAWIINDGHIMGKVIFNIRYIGMPTIWLNDLLS